MKLKDVYLLIVDKNTGVPVYSISNGEEQESKSFLFSGLMTVINQMLNEFEEKQTTRKIVTNTYSVFAREVGSFYVFIIGDFPNDDLVFTILEHIRFYLMSVPSDQANEFSEEAKLYLDIISKEFFTIVSSGLPTPQLFAYSRMDGLTKLTEDRDPDVDKVISNIVVKDAILLDQCLYWPIDENKKLVILTKVFDKEKSVIMVYKLKDFNVLEFFINRHKIIYQTHRYLDANLDFFFNFANPLEVERVLRPLIEQIRESISIKKFKEIAITDISVFLQMIRPILPRLFTILVAEGKPLAISGMPEIVVQTIYFLSTVTKISDIGFEFEEFPNRIMAVRNSDEISICKELGYYHLNVDNLKLAPKIQPNAYFKKQIEEIFGLATSSEIISSLTFLFDEIYKFIDQVLLKLAKGITIDNAFQSSRLEIDNKIIRKMIMKVNPLLLNLKREISPKSIAW